MDPFPNQADLSFRLLPQMERTNGRVEFHVRKRPLKSPAQHQVFRCPSLQRTIQRQQPEAVGAAQGQVQIVRRKQDGAIAIADQAAQQLHDFDPPRQVQKGRRLVEEEHRWFLRQGAGNHHLLPFAIAQLTDAARGQVPSPHCVNSPAHHLFVRRGKAAVPASVRVATERHECIGRQVAHIHPLSQD